MAAAGPDGSSRNAETEMKNLLLAATSLAFVAAVHLSPASAQGPKTSGDNLWPGASHAGAVQPGMYQTLYSGSSAATPPHYEWQYHYTGGHSMWRPGWVLVK
jgi:hypothetical protein